MIRLQNKIHVFHFSTIYVCYIYIYILSSLYPVFHLEHIFIGPTVERQQWYRYHSTRTRKTHDPENSKTWTDTNCDPKWLEYGSCKCINMWIFYYESAGAINSLEEKLESESCKLSWTKMPFINNKMFTSIFLYF